MDAQLGLVEQGLAAGGQGTALLEERDGLIEGQVTALEALEDIFEFGPSFFIGEIGGLLVDGAHGFRPRLEERAMIALVARAVLDAQGEFAVAQLREQGIAGGGLVNAGEAGAAV